MINSMVETGAITAAQAIYLQPALPAFPKIKTSERYGGPKGFLLKMVERELVAAGFSESQIQGGGLKITTTFDKQAQNAAVKAAQRNTRQAVDAVNKKASDLHAAVASVEVGSGEVLALYGGPDFVANSRNWATTPRPTASTFKTYALAAGLDDGFSLRSTFSGNTFTPPGDPTPVRNEFSNQYGSNVTLLRATADSINTAFVDLTGQMKGDGPDKIMKMAEAVGAPKGAGWDNTSRVALGTAEVSPLNQAGAYATFANGGTRVANHVVREVRDAETRSSTPAAPEEKRAVSEDIARDVNFALSNVVEQGTGGTVRTLNRPVAGKTGTKDVKDDITSAWFVAYTPQISTAVMYVAGADGNGDLDGFARPGDSTFFGGTYPALTWADYMQTAMEDLPVEDFEEPAYVNADAADAQPQRTYSGQSDDEPSEPEEPAETEEPARAAVGAASHPATESGALRAGAVADRRAHHGAHGVAPAVADAVPGARGDLRRRRMSSPRPGPFLAGDHPSRSDRFVRGLSERFGGPFGRHGQPGGSWWNPARVALLTATAVYLVGMMFRLPCRMTVAGRVPDVLPAPVLLRHRRALRPARAVGGQYPVPGFGGLSSARVSGAVGRLPGAGAGHHGSSGCARRGPRSPSNSGSTPP